MESKVSGFIRAEDVDFNNLAQVLAAALSNEKRGRELYLQYARTVTSPISKRVFGELAKQELRHIDDIKEFITSLDVGPAMEVNVTDMVNNDSWKQAKTFFGKLTKDLKDRVEPSDDDIKSHETAMEIEKAGYEYYQKAMEKTKKPEMKKFFAWLVEQEKAHYMLIKNALDFISNTEAWYAGEEHWLLEG